MRAEFPPTPANESPAPMNLRRQIGVWLLMLVASILNGALRDLSYGRQMPELAAHQLSTVSSLLILGLIMWLALSRWPARTRREAWRIGAFWMALTLAFEFLFFHYLGGHSWAELLANYDVAGGRVWIFVPIWLAVAPVIFSTIRSR